MDQPETHNPEKSPVSNLSLDLIEISIVLVIGNFRPDTINVDFLKYIGIIPDDWELSTNPIINNLQAQLTFTNQVKINAENNRIIFTDQSLVLGDRKQPDFKVCTQNYTVENTPKWSVGHTDEWQYKTKEEKDL